MQITQIRVYPVHEDKLKAYVSVILDDCFVVSDIKVIQGASGLFISMPSKRRKNGTYRDVAHPLNQDTRRWFEDAIIGEYQRVLESAPDNGGRGDLAGSPYADDPHDERAVQADRDADSGAE